ncbi:MAG TPA: hypothetical protein VNW06_04785 [Cytophagaceae bacterium]|jgi:hypothetical protein|nr:hypothetical protein [Cytophagaceae bacterium]
MKRKTLKMLLVGLTVTVVLLVGLSCVHLYDIAKKSHENPNNKIQLSRIDFKEPIDSSDAMKIKNYVATLDGIQGTYFNVNHGTLVYGYILGSQTPENVFEKAMTFSHNKYKALRYVVSADQLKKGCPAGMDHSLIIQFSNFLYKSFN